MFVESFSMLDDFIERKGSKTADSFAILMNSNILVLLYRRQTKCKIKKASL